MSETERGDHSADHAGDSADPSPRVAAAAIRDATDALQRERPDLAERLAELALALDADTQSSG